MTWPKFMSNRVCQLIRKSLDTYANSVEVGNALGSEILGNKRAVQDKQRFLK